LYKKLYEIFLNNRASKQSVCIVRMIGGSIIEDSISVVRKSKNRPEKVDGFVILSWEKNVNMTNGSITQASGHRISEGCAPENHSVQNVITAYCDTVFSQTKSLLGITNHASTKRYFFFLWHVNKRDFSFSE